MVSHTQEFDTNYNFNNFVYFTRLIVSQNILIEVLSAVIQYISSNPLLYLVQYVGLLNL